MKSLDLGTMFLVKGEIDELVGSPVFTVERNGFLQVSSGDDTETILKENDWSYVKNGDDLYVLGEDALKLKNLLTLTKASDSVSVTQVGQFRRPMKDGLLNTAEEKLSISIIQRLIKNLLGPPNFPGETLVFCAPSNPIDSNMSVVFHQSMMTNFLKSLGYTVECIPEALAIIYSEKPTADDPDEPDGVSKFTGISMSCGAGMVNTVLALKQMPLISFSTSRSGDWIDRESSKITGHDVSAMTKFKETSLDLGKIDYADMRQASLDIFYQQMIEYTVSSFAQKFSSLTNPPSFPLEIVIAGGTASVPGFIDKFQSVIESSSLPFKIKSIRLADNPLYTVSNGCLVKAISVEKKAKESVKEQASQKSKK